MSTSAEEDAAFVEATRVAMHSHRLLPRLSLAVIRNLRVNVIPRDAVALRAEGMSAVQIADLLVMQAAGLA